MMLIEADGKALFRAAGIVVPSSELASAEFAPAELAPAELASAGLPPVLPGSGPWMVKAQVPVGGRGKAGGVVRCASAAEVGIATRRLLGARLKGHTIDACLIEQIAEGQERYLAIMVDAVGYGLRVIYSAQGGMEIEQAGVTEGRLCAPHAGAVAEVLADMIAAEAEPMRSRIAAVGKALAEMLLRYELALAEINPLFVSESGCVAGDAKVVVDLGAIDRQPELAALIAARPRCYLDANRKIAEGFDYVELDLNGEIGLVTTGAGLSMMLIDELTTRGAKPMNFCDIRTGQMRGSPARLIRVLEWISAGPSLKAVLVNIFAGITDLGEFAGLLAAALEQSPAVTVPVVARLVGRGSAEAKRILHEKRPDIVVTEDLEEALARIEGIVKAA
jgi:succinyl-CoA synthetase beta subunit